jgi:hypothetical protein
MEYTGTARPTTRPRGIRPVRRSGFLARRQFPPEGGDLARSGALRPLGRVATDESNSPVGSDNRPQSGSRERIEAEPRPDPPRSRASWRLRSALRCRTPPTPRQAPSLRDGGVSCGSSRRRALEGPGDPGPTWRGLLAILVQRGGRQGLLPGRRAEQGSRGEGPPRGARARRRRDHAGRRRLLGNPSSKGEAPPTAVEAAHRRAEARFGGPLLFVSGRTAERQRVDKPRSGVPLEGPFLVRICSPAHDRRGGQRMALPLS